MVPKRGPWRQKWNHGFGWSPERISNSSIICFLNQNFENGTIALVLGTSWVPLGAAWGLSWGSWGPSGGVFGNMCLVLEAFGGLLESLGCRLSSKMSVSPSRRAIFQNFMIFQRKPRGACGAVHKNTDYAKDGFSPRRRAQFWQARVATRAHSWGSWAPAELKHERLAEAPCFFL